MKAVGPMIASNGDASLQMRLVGSHSTSGREMEGKKEGRREAHNEVFEGSLRSRYVSAYVCIRMRFPPLFLPNCNPWIQNNSISHIMIPECILNLSFLTIKGNLNNDPELKFKPAARYFLVKLVIRKTRSLVVEFSKHQLGHLG